MPVLLKTKTRIFDFKFQNQQKSQATCFLVSRASDKEKKKEKYITYLTSLRVATIDYVNIIQHVWLKSPSDDNHVF